MLSRKMTIWNSGAVLMAVAVLAVAGENSARADFTFGEPVKLDTVLVDCFSSDGLEMFIGGGTDLLIARRASREDDWGPIENLGTMVNSVGTDAASFISADDLELYFNSNRPGGSGDYDLYVTTRATRASPWGPPINLGSLVNSGYPDAFPSISSDGLELYFQSQRPDGYGFYDLYVSKRATPQDPWDPPSNLGPAVNYPYNDACPWVSPDGLLLFFQDFGSRPGGFGRGDIWVARRVSRSAPWEPAVNLGPTVNGSMAEQRPCLAPDGSALYFWREASTHWKSPITPILDFNSDSKADMADMAILLANWGKNQPLCDIGPYPWGNGIVDNEDLKVLMKEIDGTDLTTNPIASALEVPCNAVLGWTAVPFAHSYDIYFGTESSLVSIASRAVPLGALVSQGQLTTTFQPAGPLEYARTYYWRVDYVSGDAAPILYKGRVLSFTTEPSAYPIENIVARASSSQGGSGPERTVDGSGLDKNDGHSADAKDMWQSTVAGPHWIQFEFDKVYTLHELWVWNSNQVVEPILGFGAKTVKIEYSTDGTTWTQLEGVPEFARGTGEPGYAANTKVNFGGVSAKYVKLTIEKGWGSTPAVGLSEVRFFHIPDRSAATP